MNEIINIFEQVNMGNGIIETIYMVLVASLISYIFGLLFGIVSVITDKDGLLPNKIINKILGLVINLGRSIPFIILMITLTPFTRFLVGISYGTNATIVSLTIAAIPFVSRLIETSIKEVDKGVVESVQTMGANIYQIIFKVYLIESVPLLIRNFSLTAITLIGYSAMAGAIGGSGVGSIAINYGYHRSDNQVMLMALIILVIMVQIIQVLFDKLAKKIDKK